MQVINTNVASLFGGAALNSSQSALQTAQSRLSSGLRINSAEDDPSGLIQASTFKASILAANSAAASALSTINDTKTVDGRMAELAKNQVLIVSNGSASAVGVALLAENATIIAAGVGTTGVTATSSAASINTARETLGATMMAQRSEATVQALTSVNLSASLSAIQDTDYAVESMAASRANILQQAGMAALAQANQSSSSVMSLLR